MTSVGALRSRGADRRGGRHARRWSGATRGSSPGRATCSSVRRSPPTRRIFPCARRSCRGSASVLTERLVGEPGQVDRRRSPARICRVRGGPTRSKGADGQRTPLGDVARRSRRARERTSCTRGGRRVGAVVVNPPPDESILDRYSADELARRVCSVSARSSRRTRRRGRRWRSAPPRAGRSIEPALIARTPAARHRGDRHRRAQPSSRPDGARRTARRDRATSGVSRILNTLPAPAQRLDVGGLPGSADAALRRRARSAAADALLRRRRRRRRRRRAMARRPRDAARPTRRSRSTRRARDSARPSRTWKSPANASRRSSG